VVVCTRNRVEALSECLGSLANQEVSPARFEVVVVDNGSTDRTATFLQRWVAGDPTRRRILTEERTGLSRARNRGVEEARHEVVLFIDDDALAHTGWVGAHLARYGEDDDVGAVGGPVVLSWPSGRPAWVGPELEHWFSALDLGPEARAFPPPHGPYGANMSVRRLDVIAVGGFAIELGRRERSLVSGEEHDLFTRLWARGALIEYEPAAVVTHQVLPDRLRRAWVLRRGWAQGRGNARMQRRASGLPGSPGVRATCWAEARFAAADLRGFATVIRNGSSGATLNEVARRFGHVAAVVEHLRLRAGDILGRHRGELRS
jgi:glucosyl-dolichyl phosphate glucuronosyltransferase